ncbi:phosphoheptose isomerase [Thioalkalivibrio sp. K90mix]|uniref:SIS domain-containing protein n=1 Tax=Thioalkalivibrio sp. (strain K90mix) TaxID=396595 RepID=UPI000195A95F|nr:SIS domain-containing protein [Thioalkalivibrio sp. K90mix]ADC70836.1 phosphoheptose isomerase [Thioalkalivibrio sp. K90mix]
MREGIIEELTAASRLFGRLAEDRAFVAEVETVGQRWLQCIRDGGKVLLAGNGGSAADAQHIAAEIVCRYRAVRPGAAAIALTTDTSVLTAIGNDFGYEHVFARQVEALGQSGDVFVGITTSGRSPNVLEAFEMARQHGLVAVALTGEKGLPETHTADHVLRVPDAATARVQEVHGLIGHLLCGIVEDALVADQDRSGSV